MPFAPREVFDPRLTVSRNSIGSRFNSAGMFEVVAAHLPRFDYDPRTVSSRNLLVYSEFQNGLPSVRGGGVSVGDMSTFPGFDTGIAITSDNSYAYKQVTLQPNTTYTFSTFVRMADGTAPIITSSGSSSANDFALVVNGSLVPTTPVIENYGYGVYRVSGTYTSPSTVGLGNIGIVRYGGQSSRNFLLTGYQLNKGTTPGDYIPTLDVIAGNAMARGIIVEEAKTNFILQSENQTVSPWSGTASPALVKTLDNSGPGGMAATTFLADGSADTIWGYTSLTASATTVTASCFIKKVGSDTSNKRLMLHNRTTATYYTGDWNPATGAIVGTGWTSEQFEDGWWLCTLTQSSGITVGDGLSFYQGMVGANKALHNFKVAAPQVENGASRTSYIPTTTAAVSRSSDNISAPFSTIKGSTTQGSMSFDGFHPSYAANLGRIGITTGDDQPNRHTIYAQGDHRALVNSNNTAAIINRVAVVAGARYKGAMAWDSTGIWFSVNGDDATFLSASFPVVAENRLWIGSLGGSAPWNGIISAIEYYPRKLTPAQLKTMSTI